MVSVKMTEWMINDGQLFSNSYPHSHKHTDPQCQVIGAYEQALMQSMLQTINMSLCI